MANLPNLRFISHPEPGFGLDARIRFGFGMNCFLGAESYINGKSFIGFGLEPRNAPWIRFQFVPTVMLSLRFPLLQVSEFKYLHGGFSAIAFERGTYPKPKFSSAKSFWSSIQKFVKPVLEIQHHSTILGTFLNEKQRKAIREAVREVKNRRQGDVDRRRKNREQVMQTFDPPELPPLDPRYGASEWRLKLNELNRKRLLRDPGSVPDRFKQPTQKQGQDQKPQQEQKSQPEQRPQPEQEPQEGSLPGKREYSPPKTIIRLPHERKQGFVKSRKPDVAFCYEY